MGCFYHWVSIDQLSPTLHIQQKWIHFWCTTDLFLFIFTLDEYDYIYLHHDLKTKINGYRMGDISFFALFGVIVFDSTSWSSFGQSRKKYSQQSLCLCIVFDSVLYGMDILWQCR